MAKTRELVKRRKAIRNIRKITRTMELIATARFKKALDRAVEATAYTKKIAELAADLSATASNVSHPLLQKRDEIKKTLYLVINSNRGMCGGYNTAILREANRGLAELDANGIEIELEVSGKRGVTGMQRAKRPISETYLQFEDKPAYDAVEVIADKYLDAYIKGEIDQVQVAYMQFRTMAVQAPVVETLLPLSGVTEKTTDDAAQAQQVDYEFLPDAQSILEEILPVSFKVRLFKCFLDAAVSEQIARRVTMKAATENADEIIKDVTRLYNRARQAQITKEISEVIAGAEALS